jgi:ATP-dependent DNA helicase PIF1
VYCELLTGAAGCGKTFEIKRRIRENDLYGVMVSTTGVSAINLGTTTINSLLSYFDTESLMDRYVSGKLGKRLYSIGRKVKHLVIDEISMMDGEQLDILYDAVEENNHVHGDAELGIVICGDFCQLQPVKAKWAFQARCWPAFAENVVRMTTMYRQSDPRFLEALMFARQGKGKECMEIMREIVTFGGSLTSAFEGTTVMGTNPKVDRFNNYALSKLPGKVELFASYRWGRERGEWKYIPKVLELKEGCLVMILSNDAPAFSYANGDLGHVVDLEPGKNINVRLIRNGSVVEIDLITRNFTSTDPPPRGTPTWDKKGEHDGSPYYDGPSNRWVYGGITFYPIRLGYATTVHKTQSLTLDRVQVDFRDNFTGQPNMAYTALSRCKTPEGLRIIGTPELMAKRIKVHEEVLEWL